LFHAGYHCIYIPDRLFYLKFTKVAIFLTRLPAYKKINKREIGMVYGRSCLGNYPMSYGNIPHFALWNCFSSFPAENFEERQAARLQPVIERSLLSFVFGTDIDKYGEIGKLRY